MLTEEIFKIGMDELEMAFFNCKFNRKLYWHTVNHLSDKQFKYAIQEIIRNIAFADGMLIVHLFKYAKKTPNNFKEI